MISVSGKSEEIISLLKKHPGESVTVEFDTTALPAKSQPTTAPQGLYSALQAAKFIGKGDNQRPAEAIHFLRRRGKLHGVRQGRHYFYTLKELKRYASSLS